MRSLWNAARSYANDVAITDVGFVVLSVVLVVGLFAALLTFSAWPLMLIGGAFHHELGWPTNISFGLSVGIMFLLSLIKDTISPARS